MFSGVYVVFLLKLINYIVLLKRCYVIREEVFGNYRGVSKSGWQVFSLDEGREDLISRMGYVFFLVGMYMWRRWVCFIILI